MVCLRLARTQHLPGSHICVFVLVFLSFREGGHHHGIRFLNSGNCFRSCLLTSAFGYICEWLLSLEIGTASGTTKRLEWGKRMEG